MNLEAYLQEHGENIRSNGSLRFEISHPDSVWFILRGQVDLFHYHQKDGKKSRLNHLSRFGAGDCIFGIDLSQHQGNLGLLAIGLIEASVFRLSFEDFLKLHQHSEQSELPTRCLDAWLIGMAALLTGKERPKSHGLLPEKQLFQLENHAIAMPKKKVLWITINEGQAKVSDHLLLTSANKPFPLTPTMFIRPDKGCTLSSVATQTVLDHAMARHSLDEFHHFLIAWLINNQKEQVVEEAASIQTKKQSDLQAMHAALETFTTIFHPKKALGPETTASNHALFTACDWVARAGAIELNPAIIDDLKEAKDPIGVLARGANIRHREILLTDGWWQSDGGPFLGFTEKGNQPVALLPKGPKHYILVDPRNGEAVPINRHNQDLVSPKATMFYRPLPTRALGIKDLMKYAGEGISRELLVILAMSIAAGMIGLVTPFATGVIFERVIPTAARSDLFFLAMGLIVVGLANGLFSLTRSFALLRLEGKVDISLQAAIWDRIVSLPVPFFRNFTSGDLVVRAMSIDVIRRTVSGTVITTLLTGIFSIFYFLQLFYYSWQMALIGAALALFALVPMGLGLLKVRFERSALEVQGTLSGLVIELINGVAKLRVSGSEDRAFAVWSRLFRHEKERMYKARVIGSIVSTWNAMFSIFSMMVIFTVMMALRDTENEGLSLGQFLAFLAAFSLFLAAVLEISNTAISLLNLIPIFERAKPILQTEPEQLEGAEQPGELSGAIEVSRIAFRYVDTGPKILNDISFQIKPGQFVAVVGPSGSGKSTLFRMLLGFETPESGAIYYDGQELAGLDIRAVRRQVGVVLQNGKLMPGTIFENIIGSLPLTIEDAWAAAAMAGLDRDVRDMPMGMHTMVTDGGGTLSGGQIQRLLIARALANKPRILFFDEATSALDNQTQAIVTKSLDTLSITRIVIAHRLSTIMNADCIFVVDKGKLIESGNYQELLAKDGVFAGLVKRQIA